MTPRDAVIAYLKSQGLAVTPQNITWTSRDAETLRTLQRIEEGMRRLDKQRRGDDCTT